MDLAMFDAWLGGIATLTEPQRRRAWQALALSEAAESDDLERVLTRPLGRHVLAWRQATCSLQACPP